MGYTRLMDSVLELFTSKRNLGKAKEVRPMPKSPDQTRVMPDQIKSAEDLKVLFSYNDSEKRPSKKNVEAPPAQPAG